MDVRVGTIKKAECRRTDAFELWYWRRLLSPLDCKEIQPVHPEGNQSWIGSPELEGLMLKLKLQYFSHLMWRTDSLEKTLMLGKIEDRRKRGWQRMRWLDGITNSMNEFEQALEVGDGQGSLACCSPWSYKEPDTTEWLNWLTWENINLTTTRYASCHAVWGIPYWQVCSGW